MCCFFPCALWGGGGLRPHRRPWHRQGDGCGFDVSSSWKSTEVWRFLLDGLFFVPAARRVLRPFFPLLWSRNFFLLAADFLASAVNIHVMMVMMMVNYLAAFFKAIFFPDCLIQHVSRTADDWMMRCRWGGRSPKGGAPSLSLSAQIKLVIFESISVSRGKVRVVLSYYHVYF